MSRHKRPLAGRRRDVTSATRECSLGGYVVLMKIMRSAAAIGIARTVWKQARKPENQARIKSAVARARSRGAAGSTRTPPRAP